MIPHASGSDRRVKDALNLIESDLKTAFVTAIERINAVLAGDPPETRNLHQLAADLHQAAATIDHNRDRRNGTLLGGNPGGLP